MDKDKIIPSMETNKVLLDKLEENKINRLMTCKQLHSFLSLIKCFQAPKFFSCRHGLYSARYFTTVAESNSFSEVDFSAVGEILSSSQVNIDSELQVLDAAGSWLRHDITERGKAFCPRF